MIFVPLTDDFRLDVTNLDLVNTVGGGIFVTDTAGGVTLSALTGANAIDNGAGGPASAGGHRAPFERPA